MKWHLQKPLTWEIYKQLTFYENFALQKHLKPRHFEISYDFHNQLIMCKSKCIQRFFCVCKWHLISFQYCNILANYPKRYFIRQISFVFAVTAHGCAAIYEMSVSIINADFGALSRQCSAPVVTGWRRHWNLFPNKKHDGHLVTVYLFNIVKMYEMIDSLCG